MRNILDIKQVTIFLRKLYPRPFLKIKKSIEEIIPCPSLSVKVSTGKRRKMKIIQDDTRPLPANDQENGQQKRPRSLPTTSQLISRSKKESDLTMRWRSFKRMPAHFQQKIRRMETQNRPRSLPTISQLISCSMEKSDLKMKIVQEDASPLPTERSTTKEHKRQKIIAYIPHPSWSAKKWNSVQLVMINAVIK